MEGEELLDEPDLMEDIMDGLAAQLNMPAAAPNNPGDQSADTEEEEGSDEEEEEAGEEAVRPKPTSPSDAAEASEILERGFVACACPPWDMMGFVGRLTAWPRHKPFERRNISMKCCMHGGGLATSSRPGRVSRTRTCWSGSSMRSRWQQERRGRRSMRPAVCTRLWACDSCGRARS